MLSITFEHIIYIPGVLLLGITIGYIMGARAVRAEVERMKKRAKR
jgi:proteasome assembly chaperone (PAC2) family protein